MTKAFVFGKYLPFHNGHEAMIRFALDHCDFLSVLVCCSDREAIPGETRANWIRETFSGMENLEVRIFAYKEDELANTSTSSEAVSEQWAKVFAGLFPGYSLVVTSEPYGDYVARFLGIRHLMFDGERQQVPVSASSIRRDLFGHWQYLPDRVKEDLALKVILLGTESTGKSTLAEQLARHYHCTLVAEAGRELIADSNDFAFEDLLRVAEVHAQRIRQAVVGESPLVIIDTDIHITKSYARFVFGRELEVSKDIYAANNAQLCLYLCNDVPYEQDGTRLSGEDRNRLDLSHRTVLRENQIGLVEITGNWEERFERAVACIDHLLQRRYFQ